MSALKKLEETKPYYGFTKLRVGFHQIKLFRTVKNKFEKKDDVKSIMIELEDQVIFLPQYFRQKIYDLDICELNSCINKNEDIFLHFGGKNEFSG